MHMVAIIIVIVIFVVKPGMVKKLFSSRALSGGSTEALGEHILQRCAQVGGDLGGLGAISNLIQESKDLGREGERRWVFEAEKQGGQ